MIQRIIRFSAENKFLVLAATLVALLGAVWSMRNIPLDALPDLSDTQVIVYSRWDRSPDIIEDQVTYPITTALLGAPKVKAIRGFSDFGYSYVYVIFEDGTDMYWARTRVLEYLSKITPQLPGDVKVELGPDASSMGWVFQYALVDRSGAHSLDELRSFQDWFLRYSLQSVPGVSEVATVGGQVRQYQVTVNPNALASYKLPLEAVIQAVRQGNNDVGGRLVELAGREYMVRGRGYVKSLADIENLVLKSEGGTPVRIKDVATVALGPEMRRGIADYEGEGDVVGGIVVMRQGENALQVIERVKAKLEEMKPSLPKGVEVVTTYDRSELIQDTLHIMPVFTLVDQEGRLFRPLAFSKNLAMAIAALLAITLDPAMRMLFARVDPFHFRPRFLAKAANVLLVGRYSSEEHHPISRFLHRVYERPCRFVVKHAKATIAVSLLLVLATVPVYLKLGHEFMPPLREGTLLYMPSAVEPGMSVAEAQHALQVQDKILKTFPEVERVFGKAGRANTSTDPAPST